MWRHSKLNGCICFCCTISLYVDETEISIRLIYSSRRRSFLLSGRTIHLSHRDSMCIGLFFDVDCNTTSRCKIHHLNIRREIRYIPSTTDLIKATNIRHERTQWVVLSVSLRSRCLSNMAYIIHSSFGYHERTHWVVLSVRLRSRCLSNTAYMIHSSFGYIRHERTHWVVLSVSLRSRCLSNTAYMIHSSFGLSGVELLFTYNMFSCFSLITRTMQCALTVCPQIDVIIKKLSVCLNGNRIWQFEG